MQASNFDLQAYLRRIGVRAGDSAQAGTAIAFKGRMMALTVVEIRDPDPERLAQDIQAHMAKAGDFFRGMPVVISLYNAFTGLAVSFEGYVLGNEALIIAGMMVGAAGILLTRLMAKAMNRPIRNVLFSNFGGGAGGEAQAITGGNGGGSGRGRGLWDGEE